MKSKITSAQKAPLLTALDVGSSKVCCFIARVDDKNRIHILGMGHRLSEGVRGGAIVDLEKTEQAIRNAVDQAERMAGENVEDVIVNVSTGQPHSRVVEANVPINGHGVEMSDVDKVLRNASDGIIVPERHLVHAFPACFSVDQSIGIRDPLGMFGSKLDVAMHVIDVTPGPIKNLNTCVGRGHLNITNHVLSPYASGMACLVDDEHELGTACIDFGGGTTSVSVFAQNAMIYADIIPIGGHHITEAIARELLTPIEHAERLKTLYGNATTARSDGADFIDVPIIGEDHSDEDGQNRIQKTQLTGVIEPRIVEILERVAKSLKKSGFDNVSGRRVVITGGGSLLPGLRDLAQKVLGKQVRIGRPQGFDGLAENASGPAFSTCAGLLMYALKAPLEMGEQKFMPSVGGTSQGGISRLVNWFKNSF